MTSRRVRTALLRLAAPFRRRHPVVLGGPGITQASPVTVRWLQRHAYLDRDLAEEGLAASPPITDYYASERDPSDEAGA